MIKVELSTVNINKGYKLFLNCDILYLVLWLWKNEPYGKYLF